MYNAAFVLSGCHNAGFLHSLANTLQTVIGLGCATGSAELKPDHFVVYTGRAGRSCNTITTIYANPISSERPFHEYSSKRLVHLTLVLECKYGDGKPFR
jgi:hypothetical protein